MIRIIKITTNKATGRAFPEQYFLSITAECFCLKETTSVEKGNRMLLFSVTFMLQQQE